MVHGTPPKPSFAVHSNVASILVGSFALKEGSRINTKRFAFSGKPSVLSLQHPGMSRANKSILSSYTPSRTSRHIRISVNSLLFRWVTPMCSCMSAIMCAFRPPTVDGSPPWSPERSDLVTSCTACLEVGLSYRCRNSFLTYECRGY